MKKFILLLLVFPGFIFIAKAQLGYNYAQYSLGFGAGINIAKTDVPYPVHTPAVNFNAGYNYTPYTRFSIEYEMGKLDGGYGQYYSDAVKSLNNADDITLAIIPVIYEKTVDPYRRSYSNHYQSIVLHSDVQLGEFIDYSDGGLIGKVLRNFYVGTGIGTIYNNIKSINRISPDSTYAYGGSNSGNNILIPVRAGYQFKIYNAYDEPNITFELGYQTNYVLGYGLDGYSDPIFTTRNFERYSGWQFSLRFNFGDVTSYRKAVH